MFSPDDKSNSRGGRRKRKRDDNNAANYLPARPDPATGRSEFPKKGRNWQITNCKKVGTDVEPAGSKKFSVAIYELSSGSIPPSSSECHQSVINRNSNFMSLWNAISPRHATEQWGSDESRKKRPPKFAGNSAEPWFLRDPLSSSTINQNPIRNSISLFFGAEKMEKPSQVGKKKPPKKSVKLQCTLWCSGRTEKSENARRLTAPIKQAKAPGFCHSWNYCRRPFAFVSQSVVKMK